MNILLHICCAPCAVYPLRELSQAGRHSIAGFFYNPNIHPSAEMEKRRRAVADFAASGDFKIEFAEYDTRDFFKNIGKDTNAPSRCRRCWSMRLDKTAKRAREGGFDAFTTTLLVSPYQEREDIVQIGSELGDKFGVRFLDNDFRIGFKEAQQFAREHGIYRQKYCGCVFSEKERRAKRESDY